MTCFGTCWERTRVDELEIASVGNSLEVCCTGEQRMGHWGKWSPVVDFNGRNNRVPRLLGMSRGSVVTR